MSTLERTLSLNQDKTEVSPCLIPEIRKAYGYTGSPHYLMTNEILEKSYLMQIHFKLITMFLVINGGKNKIFD